MGLSVVVAVGERTMDVPQVVPLKRKRVFKGILKHMAASSMVVLASRCASSEVVDLVMEWTPWL